MVQAPDGTGQSTGWTAVGARRQNRLGQGPHRLRWSICRIQRGDWRLFPSRRRYDRRSSCYRKGMPRSAVRRSRGSQAGGRRMSDCKRTQARSGVRHRLNESEIVTRKIASVAFIAASATSTTGLTALAVEKFRLESQSKSSPNQKGLNMPRVVHFEIYTDDPEAVRPFYQGVFGWKFKKFEGGPIEYWLVTTGDDKEPGINGGLTRPREGQSPGTLNTICVSSLDELIKKVEQAGGKICVPKMAIPKVGWLAYAEDPAGNVFGMIEPTETRSSEKPTSKN